MPQQPSQQQQHVAEAVAGPLSSSQLHSAATTSGSGAAAAVDATAACEALPQAQAQGCAAAASDDDLQGLQGTSSAAAHELHTARTAAAAQFGSAERLGAQVGLVSQPDATASTAAGAASEAATAAGVEAGASGEADVLVRQGSERNEQQQEQEQALVEKQQQGKEQQQEQPMQDFPAQVAEVAAISQDAMVRPAAPAAAVPEPGVGGQLDHDEQDQQQQADQPQQQQQQDVELSEGVMLHQEEEEAGLLVEGEPGDSREGQHLEQQQALWQELMLPHAGLHSTAVESEPVMHPREAIEAAAEVVAAEKAGSEFKGLPHAACNGLCTSAVDAAAAAEEPPLLPSEAAAAGGVNDAEDKGDGDGALSSEGGGAAAKSGEGLGADVAVDESSGEEAVAAAVTPVAAAAADAEPDCAAALPGVGTEGVHGDVGEESAGALAGADAGASLVEGEQQGEGGIPAVTAAVDKEEVAEAAADEVEAAAVIATAAAAREGEAVPVPSAATGIAAPSEPAAAEPEHNAEAGSSEKGTMEVSCSEIQQAANVVGGAGAVDMETAEAPGTETTVDEAVADHQEQQHAPADTAAADGGDHMKQATAVTPEKPGNADPAQAAAAAGSTPAVDTFPLEPAELDVDPLLGGTPVAVANEAAAATPELNTAEAGVTAAADSLAEGGSSKLSALVAGNCPSSGRRPRDTDYSWMQFLPKRQTRGASHASDHNSPGGDAGAVTSTAGKGGRDKGAPGEKRGKGKGSAATGAGAVAAAGLKGEAESVEQKPGGSKGKRASGGGEVASKKGPARGGSKSRLATPGKPTASAAASTAAAAPAGAAKHKGKQGKQVGKSAGKKQQAEQHREVPAGEEKGGVKQEAGGAAAAPQQKQQQQGLAAGRNRRSSASGTVVKEEEKQHAKQQQQPVVAVGLAAGRSRRSSATGTAAAGAAGESTVGSAIGGGATTGSAVRAAAGKGQHKRGGGVKAGSVEEQVGSGGEGDGVKDAGCAVKQPSGKKGGKAGKNKRKRMEVEETGEVKEEVDGAMKQEGGGALQQQDQHREGSPVKGEEVKQEDGKGGEQQQQQGQGDTLAFAGEEQMDEVKEKAAGGKADDGKQEDAALEAALKPEDEQMDLPPELKADAALCRLLAPPLAPPLAPELPFASTGADAAARDGAVSDGSKRRGSEATGKKRKKARSRMFSSRPKPRAWRWVVPPAAIAKELAAVQEEVEEEGEFEFEGATTSGAATASTGPGGKRASVVGGAGAAAGAGGGGGEVTQQNGRSSTTGGKGSKRAAAEGVAMAVAAAGGAPAGGDLGPPSKRRKSAATAAPSPAAVVTATAMVVGGGSGAAATGAASLTSRGSLGPRSSSGGDRQLLLGHRFLWLRRSTEDGRGGARDPPATLHYPVHPALRPGLQPRSVPGIRTADQLLVDLQYVYNNVLRVYRPAQALAEQQKQQEALAAAAAVEQASGGAAAAPAAPDAGVVSGGSSKKGDAETQGKEVVLAEGGSSGEKKALGLKVLRLRGFAEQVQVLRDIKHYVKDYKGELPPPLPAPDAGEEAEEKAAATGDPPQGAGTETAAAAAAADAGKCVGGSAAVEGDMQEAPATLQGGKVAGADGAGEVAGARADGAGGDVVMAEQREEQQEQGGGGGEQPSTGMPLEAVKQGPQKGEVVEQQQGPAGEGSSPRLAPSRGSPSPPPAALAAVTEATAGAAGTVGAAAGSVNADGTPAPSLEPSQQQQQPRAGCGPARRIRIKGLPSARAAAAGAAEWGASATPTPTAAATPKAATEGLVVALPSPRVGVSTPMSPSYSLVTPGAVEAKMVRLMVQVRWKKGGGVQAIWRAKAFICVSLLSGGLGLGKPEGTRWARRG